MENYEILTQIGEGTFGQVYKAKNRLNGEIVAFKVIRKRGRSIKELKSLRQECEIQRHLHHPNIVQMLDSFETDNEIIIVTEYANRELYEILGKAGRLSEHRAQIIACDLVSALYYLHSNRVLHRDLKPQNILLENNGVAKLCDFGFARSMSTGTHVLTSIKGTPLYMAPELIEERPYDHNADLWSLGCIVYELVVGTPPFQTTSILNLVRLIRYKAIKWPAYISETCKSFLQGLLQKDPSQRLSWPALLEHPFVKNKIKIVNTGTVPSPFTAPLSASQARAKQQQLQNLDTRPAYLSKLSDKAAQILEEQARKLEVRRQRTCTSHPRYPLSQAYCHHRINQCQALRHSEPSGTDSSTSVDVLLGNMSLRDSLRSELFYVANGLNRSIDGIPESKVPNITTRDTMRKHVETETTCINSPVQQSEATINKEQIEDNGLRERGSVKTDTEPHFDRNNSIKVQERLPDWLPRAIERPIENEEWAVFLQRSMEEIMEGEVGSLLQENCVSVFVSPLRNTSVGSRVLEYVACLLSLPFVVSVSKDTLNKIERVYLDVRVVPNLVYAMKLLLSERERPESERNETDTINAPVRSASTLSADELQALECAMLLLCRLIHNQDQFAAQFCDAIHIVNGIVVLQQLLTLEKRKARVVADLIAIFCNLLRSQRENIDLVEAVLLERERMGGDLVDQLVKLVTHRQSVLRSRTCILIRLLARLESRVLEKCWTQVLKSSIEALTDDEDKTIQNLAEKTIAELRQLFHYNQGRNPAEQSS